MNDQTIYRLLAYLDWKVTPAEHVLDKGLFDAELTRLQQELQDTFESPETGVLASQLAEMIRDMAWEIDEATGSRDQSQRLIWIGQHRTWSIDD